MENIRYYKVKVSPAPRITDIRLSADSQMTIITPDQPRCCRMISIHSGSLTIKSGEHTEQYGEGAVLNVFYDHNAVHQPKGAYQTFGFMLELSDDPVPMTAKEVIQWNPEFHEVIIPTEVSDPIVSSELADLIKNIVNIRFSQELLFSLKCRVSLHRIFLLLTEYSVKQAGTWKTKHIQQESRHCLRAEKYIQDHLCEKIVVDDIAAAAGISYNYLNRLFASHNGMTLVEYINRAKVRKVEQLLFQEGLTAEEAGERVGIHDVKYLSRLFRRYSGMTITEYLRSVGLKKK